MQIRVTESVLDVPDTALYEVVKSGVPNVGTCVAVVGLMHGDEPVGGLVLDRLKLELAEQLTQGSVLLVRANVAAAQLGLRHTPDGTDMNRLWDRENLERVLAADPGGLCHEEIRARDLGPLLRGCDAILDLHSTSRPSPQCLLFRDDLHHAHIAQSLGVPHVVTGLHESAILSGGLCSNIGLSPGEYSPRLGFTYEAGQHADPTNFERAWLVTVRLLHALNMWRSVPPPIVTQPRVYEVLERFRQAPAGTEPYRFVGYEGGEAGSPRKGQKRELASFEAIEGDEMLLRRGRDTVVRAEAPFTMLMPCPSAEPGTDLYYVTQRRHGGLAFGRPRGDEQARAEATAIERMLDLLDDDAFARGNTWVSFDARRILDLCAEMIGRAIRMPPSAKHRKITVVGRGDWGGDEAERRAGQRYRQAMRMAMVEGIPVDRIQLLRGASLGWLDALTSESMLRVMAQRADKVGTTGGIRLLLSARQPHTVSVLVVGDLEHALATGETRQVRAALVVEEAMVEPDGAGVRARIVRACVVSDRLPFLRSVKSLVDALRDDHQHLLTWPMLATHAPMKALLADDGAIEFHASPAALEDLRRVLSRLQVRLWGNALQHVVTEGTHLPSDADLGRYLANIMVATGILDVTALTRLLIRRTADGYVVDASVLRAVENEGSWPDGPVNAPFVVPTQPYLARDVTADSLERWVGWKRFVRGVEVIPGTRGTDLELGFTERKIQRRVGQWFSWARKLGERSPGNAMLVLAGDGMSSAREREEKSWAVVANHRALLQDPNVAYLRIQHSPGLSVGWMRDVAESLASRPPGAPVGIAWEEEHGAVVNVVLVCTRNSDAKTSEWSLDGWSIEGCAILVSDLRRTGGGYKIALFTRRGSAQSLNDELAHFGRQHCEGLLGDVNRRVYAPNGQLAVSAIRGAVVREVSGFIRRMRAFSGLAGRDLPADPRARAQWVANYLGLLDEGIAEAVARHMETTDRADEAAEAVWERAETWPGPLWEGLQSIDR
jgi:predicted deacylase